MRTPPRVAASRDPRRHNTHLRIVESTEVRRVPHIAGLLTQPCPVHAAADPATRPCRRRLSVTVDNCSSATRSEPAQVSRVSDGRSLWCHTDPEESRDREPFDGLSGDSCDDLEVLAEVEIQHRRPCLPTLDTDPWLPTSPRTRGRRTT